MKFHLPKFPSRLREQRVLLRVDFNVPVKRGHVQDDMRIKKTLPTIRELQKLHHKIILMSHLEDENGNTPTLLPIATYLRSHVKNLLFANHSSFDFEALRKKIDAMDSGDVLLLENLRQDPREKKNDDGFAKELAALADIYVNDAFSASHREHASIVGVPRHLPHYAGPLLAEEIRHLSRAFRPPHPFVIIIAGRKPIKLLLLARFLRKADTAITGGVIANTILHKKGIRVGQSVVEDGVDKETLDAFIHSRKILLPKDVIVSRQGKDEIVNIHNVQKSDIIYDIGPETVEEIRHILWGSRFVLWNGPLGYAEKGYEDSTYALAQALIKGGKKSIVGGGDTIAYLNKKNILHKFPFVSTGGGAMLEFLAERTLPGIEALMKE